MVMNRLLLTLCLVLLAFRELPLTAGRLMDRAEVKDAEIPSEEQHRELIFLGCGLLGFPARRSDFNLLGPDECVNLCVGIFDIIFLTVVPFGGFFSDAEALGSCAEIGEECEESGDCLADAGCGRDGGSGGEFVCCAPDDFNGNLLGDDTCNEP